jgi:hypothetical protein
MTPIENAEQIERCIEEAQDKLAREGSAHCNQSDIQLAGIGYQNQKFIEAIELVVAKMESRTITLDLSGKGSAAIFTAVGGLITGAVLKVFGVQL